MLKPHFSKKHGLAWLVFGIGLLVTTFATLQVKQEVEIDALKQFSFTCDQIALKVQERLGAYALALQGGSALFSVSNNIERQDWKTYVETLRSGNNIIGIHGMGFNQLVPAHHLAQHITHIRGEGFPEYTVHPSGNSSFYTPVVYIEPFSGSNLRAFGYDTFAEPIRRLAMEQSRDTGNVTVSGKVELIQETGQDNQSGVIMYVPVYLKGSTIVTVQQRRAAIIGWVSAPYRMNDLMAGILSDWAKHEGKAVDLVIYDGSTARPAAQLFDSDLSNNQSSKSQFYQQRSIDLNGHKWLLAFDHLAAEASINYINAWLVLFSGLTISGLLFGLLLSIIKTRSSALRIADELTEEIRLREQSLRESESHLRLSQKSGGIGTWEADLIKHTQIWSENCMSLLGFPALSHPTWEDFLAIVHPEDRQHVINATQAHIENGAKYDVEYRAAIANGEIRWMRSVGQVECNAEDQPVIMRGIVQDITERKLMDNNLRIAATTFESQEGMMVTDAKNIILRVNQAFTLITGYTAEEAVGKTPSLLNSGRQDKHFYAAMWDSISHVGAWEGEIWNRRKSGEIYPEHLAIAAVKDATGVVINYVATITDITMSKAASDEIKNLAFYDPLTKLPNRRLLLDRLNQALTSSVRSKQIGAILFLDLDHFKTLNDTLGHDIGDLLLKQVALRLSACVREGDTVARLGGDEFVVLLEDLSEQTLEAATHTETIANKVLHTLNEPYQLNGYEYHSTPSIGATLFDDHQLEIDELLKQADIAMYEAKSAGRNTLRFFDKKMQEVITARVDLEQELRKAVELQQFQLHYQIQVNSAGHSLGAEALIRWQHPDRGIISPFHFIPLAEDTELILPIGQWVLETACAQLKLWNQNDLTRHLTLSVNVSAKQFLQTGFVEQVQATVKHHGINPTRLKLELTESMLVDNIESIIVTMNALSEIGIKFSLDDFGTGYSSLQYLKKLPLYQLKIDQSFVHDIVSDKHDRAIVRTIIAMAYSLDLSVIAEGVETEEQKQLLINKDCMNFQGHLFSKPVPIEEFEALL